MRPRPEKGIFVPLVRYGGHEFEIRQQRQPMSLLREYCDHFLGDKRGLDTDIFSQQTAQPTWPGFGKYDYF